MVRAKMVTVMRWYAQDEVNQESEHNEVDAMKKKKGADSTGKVMIYDSLWLLIVFPNVAMKTVYALSRPSLPK